MPNPRAANPAFSFNAFRGRRIFVVGDVMLDEYLRGRAQRISPEAPVPVVAIEERRYFPGGAGNVAANIASLGGIPFLAGVVGEDNAASVLRHELATRGVQLQALATESGRFTTSKTRVLAGSHQVVRFDHETTAAITHATEDQLLEKLHAAPEIDGYVLSDYAKGVLTARICQEVIRLARERGVPVIVDPKGTDFTRYQGATVITPNFQEAFAAAQKLSPVELAEEASDAGVERIIATLRGSGSSSLLITRGADGMTIADSSAAPVHIPAQARQVFDVTGAGDTVVATLVLAMAAHATLEQAARIGNLAAGIVVGQVGTSAVTAAQIEQLSVAAAAARP